MVSNGIREHGDLYDYSASQNLNKITALTKIAIKCNKCQLLFNQLVTNHINSQQGCPQCADRIPYNYESFVLESIKKHKNLYDYSYAINDIIKNNRSEVTIKCRECGNKFTQSINSHINQESGCPKCCNSKGEMLIKDYLSDDFDYIAESILPGLPKKRYDFLLPEWKYIIEYDGMQHFKYVEHFHKDTETFEIKLQIDVDKSVEALKQGYTLIRISYDMNDYDSISNYLDYVFNTNKQFYVSHNTLYNEHIKKVIEIIPEVSEKICVGYNLC